ncbi:hypothetical protein [Acinetobacter sp. ANC 3791]|uniref:hypothetical protein n=1 Tax=Acinetobacter sp. ANC 3791 TaxID=2529836 RepID=UPI00103B3FF0|nr:hypothetical protein [Acinetobacter sp. ANC 3791]TCB86317.1 hypothetical protein E0H90_00385 [Acinetobacter sp. ANC 3791]
MQYAEEEIKKIEQDMEKIEFNEDSTTVERLVPVSEAEFFGLGILKDGSVVLELGYIKNIQNKQMVVDVRKKLSPQMIIDIRDYLTDIINQND